MISRYCMDIYMAFNGVQATMRWPDEEAYRRGRDLLRAMGCGSGDIRDDFDPQKPEFFYLENEQQLDALYELRHALGVIPRYRSDRGGEFDPT